MPTRGDIEAAGWDLYVPGPTSHTDNDAFDLTPGERTLISIKINIEIPSGYYGKIAPRSSLAVNWGIDVMAGVIDSSYRGEIKVLLINHGNTIYEISRGQRIAQLIIQPYLTSGLTQVHSLHNLGVSQRGCGGFGSTGK